MNDIDSERTVITVVSSTTDNIMAYNGTRVRIYIEIRAFFGEI